MLKLRLLKNYLFCLWDKLGVKNINGPKELVDSKTSQARPQSCTSIQLYEYSVVRVFSAYPWPSHRCASDAVQLSS